MWRVNMIYNDHDQDEVMTMVFWINSEQIDDMFVWFETMILICDTYSK